MPLFRAVAVVASLGSLSLAAQQTGAVPNPNRPVPATLQPYVSCKLPLGPEMTQHTSLPQAPMTRTAQTLTGPQPIKLMDGVFAAFAFPGSAPFANVKIEQLPASTYAPEKANLISEFDSINAKGEDTKRNYDLKPVLNGFEIYGFDRTALDGRVLGIYLFFDNPHHIATTAYFLNAPAGERKFSTVAEYDQLREAFLNAYTVCIRRQLSDAPTATSTAKVVAKPGAKALAKPGSRAGTKASNRTSSKSHKAAAKKRKHSVS